MVNGGFQMRKKAARIFFRKRFGRHVKLSLKMLLEALKKSNNTSKIIKNANKRNQTMNKNNNLFDKYNFTFNNNHNQNSSISPKNMLRRQGVREFLK